MASRKGSAKARQAHAFEESFDLGLLDGAFAEERRRQERDAERRADALREKACTSKNRYATRSDALEAAAACAAHGRGGLHVYRCPHCDGWHLTSHPQDPGAHGDAAQPRGRRGR